MGDFSDFARSWGPADSVVHIGAGHCLEAEAYLAGTAARIMLIEAVPALAADLRSRFVGEPRITVTEAAISGRGGAARLRVFNSAAANSLRKPKKIFERYPNLRMREERTINTIAVSNLIEKFDLKPDAVNALVVTWPGEEASIVAALMETDIIRLFSHVAVRADIAGAYLDSQDANASADILLKAGYTIEIANDDDGSSRISGSRNAQALSISQSKAIEEQAAKAKEDLLKTTEALQETKHRTKMMAEELSRLEGQLKLIKDVLLRDRAG